MIPIEFDFDQNIIKVQGNIKNKFQDAVNKFAEKSLLDPKNIYFLGNGNIFDPEKTLEEQMSKDNKNQNVIKIIVKKTVEEENKTPIIIQSKDIICPKCHEPCKYKMDNYKIKLYDCINNHLTDNIKLKDFPNTQKINISSIVCEKCIRSKADTYQYIFFRCTTCSHNLCPWCKEKHDPNHRIIRYEQKDYKCEKHCSDCVKYCQICKKNLCLICDNEHNNHNKIYFGDIIPDTDKLKKYMSELKTTVSLFNDKINLIISKLKELSQAMNIYYEMKNNILNNYENNNRNYCLLQNLKEIISKDLILEKMKNINGTQNLGENLINMIDLYNKINLIYEEMPIKKTNEVPINVKNPINQVNKSNKITNSKIIKPESANKAKKDENNVQINSPSKDNFNKMTIIYNIGEKDDKINILNETFVNNNKNNCYIVIEGKQRELCNQIIINKNQKDNKILEIKLIEIKTITNMSCMFKGCTSLIYLPDISNWDTKDITNMNSMFELCISLKTLSDISKWETSKVNFMSNMFSGCCSLQSLPDISKWNVSNVKNISNMFNGCKALQTLPEISNWDISNVTDMSNMFNGCISLKSLPDISRWNMKNVNNIQAMFKECKSLKYLPNISKWDTKNILNMNYLFYKCESLQSLPPISKWVIQKETSMICFLNVSH